MRTFAPLVVVVLICAACAAGCGDEASSVRGSWNVDRLTVSFAENLECTDLGEQQQANAAGTMAFDDVPHPDGIGDHTFTYSLTKVPDPVAGELVDADPPLEGTAGWEPDDGKEETDGFTVTDPVNASMQGLWNILESALGAVNVEHLAPESIPEEGDRCVRSEYFLVAP